ncbi:MAG: phosphatase PAP2 family protein [Gemmatimonadaceae bacterium]
MRRSASLILLTLMLGAGLLPAQPADTLRPPQALLTRDDALFAGAATVATLLTILVDEPIREALQDSSVQDNSSLSSTARRIAPFNEFRHFYVSAALYGIGRIAGQEEIADLGLHAAEAVLISRGLTDIIAGLAGRARPRITDDGTSFELLRGFEDTDFHSLPSRHATGAFALATVASLETRRYWPGAARYVTPLLYAGATLVGLGRMYTDDHWASDVVSGAAVGIFTGMNVVGWMHSHPGNAVDGWLLRATPLPEYPGTILLYIDLSTVGLPLPWE